MKTMKAILVFAIMLLAVVYGGETDIQPQDCPGDLVWKDCGSCPQKCPESEKELTTRPICPKRCYPGCQCPKDTWRVRSTDRCVQRRDCPTPKCSGDLIWFSCGSACREVCGKPEPTVCISRCEIGCACPVGQWRIGETDQCVPTARDCPVIKTA